MKLKEIIKETGLKQEHIAKLMEISRFTVSNWVNGYTSPTLKQAYKLKEILNLNSIDELIDKEAS